jgi:hypothetical protein
MRNWTVDFKYPLAYARGSIMRAESQNRARGNTDLQRALDRQVFWLVQSMEIIRGVFFQFALKGELAVADC